MLGGSVVNKWRLDFLIKIYYNCHSHKIFLCLRRKNKFQQERKYSCFDYHLKKNRLLKLFFFTDILKSNL